MLSPTRMCITFDATDERSSTAPRLSTPSGKNVLRRSSSAGRITGRLTPMASRVPKGSSSLGFKEEDLTVLGTTADALAFLNAGCRVPRTPAKIRPPGYLPQLGPGPAPEPGPPERGPPEPDPPEPGVLERGAPRLSSGHVEFCPTPMNTVHVITPYSKVYGKHPSLFNYDRKGEMQLNDKGVAALMEDGADLDVD